MKIAGQQISAGAKLPPQFPFRSHPHIFDVFCVYVLIPGLHKMLLMYDDLMGINAVPDVWNFGAGSSASPPEVVSSTSFGAGSSAQSPPEVAKSLSLGAGSASASLDMTHAMGRAGSPSPEVADHSRRCSTGASASPAQREANSNGLSAPAAATAESGGAPGLTSPPDAKKSGGTYLNVTRYYVVSLFATSGCQQTVTTIRSML